MKTSNQKNSSFMFQEFVQEVGSRFYDYYKHTSKNPEWTAMNIISRFTFLRRISRIFNTKAQLKKYDSAQSLFSNINVENVVNELNKNGYFSGVALPKTIFQDILNFALTTDCYGNLDHNLGFTYSQKKEAELKSGTVFSTATYYNLDLICPAVKKLAYDPILLLIAANYLGAEPLFTDSRLWWTFATSEKNYDISKTASFFHYDVDDYNCIRFFFYLTDVDLESGPHILLRGSHRKKKLSHIISIGQRKDKNVIDFYGDENVVTIDGKAGSGFVEDPFCFHKATRPTGKDRLLLQLRYATKDYGILKSTADSSKLKNIFESNI